MHRAAIAALLIVACGGETTDAPASATDAVADVTSDAPKAPDPGPVEDGGAADTSPEDAPEPLDSAPPDDATVPPAPVTCEKQPKATPPKVTEDTVNGSAFAWASPEAPIGLLLLFHGAGGSWPDMVKRPETAFLTQHALAQGFAIASLDSVAHLTAGETPDFKWSKDDSADNSDVANAILMSERLRDPNDLAAVPANAPVYALGASNGGTFVSRLAQHLPMPAVVVFISNAQLFQKSGSVLPPMVLVPAENDKTVDAASMETLAGTVANHDIDVLLRTNVPAPLTGGWLTRLPGIDCPASLGLRAAFLEAGVIDAAGFQAAPPSASGWVAQLPSGTTGVQTAQIRDVLMELYADHSLTSEFDAEIMAFLSAHTIPVALPPGP